MDKIRFTGSRCFLSIVYILLVCGRKLNPSPRNTFKPSEYPPPPPLPYWFVSLLPLLLYPSLFFLYIIPSLFTRSWFFVSVPPRKLEKHVPPKAICFPFYLRVNSPTRLRVCPCVMYFHVRELVCFLSYIFLPPSFKDKVHLSHT